MIKIILSIGVITMIFSGCVGIGPDDPITKGYNMEINYPHKAENIVKHAKNINTKNTKREIR